MNRDEFEIAVSALSVCILHHPGVFDELYAAPMRNFLNNERAV